MPIAELVVIALFAIWVAKPILNFDEHMIPGGDEFWVNVQSSRFWDYLQSCGQCAFWNGSNRGGAPAIADFQSSNLHPIVAISVLAFGWVNGAKVTVAAALFLAGFSQWWLARVLGLGPAARLWSGCVAAAAGNMTGRMADGSVVLVVSGAACAMVLPPLIQLSRDGRFRSAAVLGIAIGLALVSGQAYYQFAGVLLAPFVLFVLTYRNSLGAPLLLRRYALAGIIGVCIASPFIVPYLNAMSFYGKSVDPDFRQAQPFAYIPLNLVIGDWEYYQVEVLGKIPTPYLHLIFVGWFAVLLAFVGMSALWIRRERSRTIALVTVIIMSFWLASAQPLHWMVNASDALNLHVVHDTLIGLRSVSLFSGLAVMPILAFAAVGLDVVWRYLSGVLWLGMGGKPGSSPAFRVSPRWGLVVLMFLSANSVREFSRHSIYLMPDRSDEMAPVLDALETDDLQWVKTPQGREAWYGPALQRDLKLAVNPLSWTWNPSTLPPATKVADTSLPEGPFVPQGTFGDVTVYAAAPGNEYAAIVHPDGTRTVCSAHGVGGDIDITCPASSAGQLVVLEHMIDGWNATVDGERGTFTKDTLWIGVDMPTGATHIQLRYRPWDVPVGVALMIAGLIVAAGAFWLDRGIRIRRPQKGHAKLT